LLQLNIVARYAGFSLLLLGFLAQSPVFAENEKALPRAPEWRQGTVSRGADGTIELDSGAVDRLAQLTQGKRRIGLGSGFFVTRDGAVVTNYHVVKRCRMVTVETPWQAVEVATVIVFDEAYDLALLRSDITPPIAIKFSVDSVIRPGSPLSLIGYPSVRLPPLSPQVSSAVFVGPVSGRPLVALDTTVAPGSSGGPVVDLSGGLVAIVAGEINTPAYYKKTGKLVRNIAFAVPAHAAERLLSANGIAIAHEARDRKPLDAAALTALAMGSATKIGCWS